ncbi:hypothetical protein ACF08M_40700 [Streptomyces sp. NPDC015032]|uniref:hypothetical protein n=1 Tax=Streptomyces sp. NPDC015032 TaxID=3364937 RepID=UPI0036FCD51D
MKINAEGNSRMPVMFKRGMTAAIGVAVLVGGVVALAPTASAVGRSACTVEVTPGTWKTTVGSVNLRNGPSTRYYSKGLLSKGTKFRSSCGKGQWDYVKVLSGAHKNTYGWIDSYAAEPTPI